MSRLEVFEPAMCCPTGVCGIEVDPVLVQFNADLQALEASGVTVSRHSLSHDAAAFTAQPLVLREMEAGMDRLPVVMLDGLILSTGLYPTLAQMQQRIARAEALAAKPRIKLGSGGDCVCAPGQCC